MRSGCLIDIAVISCYNYKVSKKWGRIWFRRGFGIKSSESLSPSNEKSGKNNKRKQ